MSDRVRQCKTCPWRVGASVDRIPGYDRAKHEALRDTMDQELGPVVRIMACHYSDPSKGQERPCAGWLHQQYQADNIPVLVNVRTGKLPAPIVSGPQRKTFDETFADSELLRRSRMLSTATDNHAQALAPLLPRMLTPARALRQAKVAAAQERERISLQAHASPPYCGRCRRSHPTFYLHRGRRKGWHDLGDAQMSPEQRASRERYEEAFNAEVARQQEAAGVAER